MTDTLCGVVLAAGKGTRMHCDTSPKVMRTLLGEPMLRYVLDALGPTCGQNVRVVVGFCAEVVQRAFPEYEGRFVLQAEQRGTGHALVVAWPTVKASGAGWCLVVNGDTPLLDSGTLAAFCDASLETGADVVFATITPEGHNAFGRVVRDDAGAVAAIVEAKDYDADRYGPEPSEVNAGLYLFRVASVEPLLSRLTDDNAGGEYYITDLVALALQAGLKVEAVECGDDPALMGINTPHELIVAEERLVEDIVFDLLDQGVLVRNPGQVRVGPRVRVAAGAELRGPCEVQGATYIGRGAVVEPFCVVSDSSLAEGAVVRSFSHLEGAEVGPDCMVGPYARLRPGAELKEGARVGNFVEMKKSVLGEGSKASHLTYLGDAEIGPGVNIGAGTITCNYDGKRKHKTIIRGGAFIGSNTALVAPVTVGENALVGAGSTITKDVPDNALAVARSRQVELPRRK